MGNKCLKSVVGIHPLNYVQIAVTTLERNHSISEIGLARIVVLIMIETSTLVSIS